MVNNPAHSNIIYCTNLTVIDWSIIGQGSLSDSYKSYFLEGECYKGATDIRFALTMSSVGLDMVNHMVKFCVAVWIEMFLFFRCRKRCARQQISKCISSNRCNDKFHNSEMS